MIRWVVLIVLVLACFGALYYGRPRPTPPLDLRTILDRRNLVLGKVVNPAWADRLRALSASATVDGPIAPALALAMGEEFLEGDAPETTGWMTDVDGDGSRDLVLKRYWTGTGVGFDLLIILNCRSKPTCYRFNGGERGGTYYAREDLIPVQHHILDLRNDGHKVVVVPEVLIDRGADTVLNWPTLYAFDKGCFVIVDRQHRSFYEERLLPKLPAWQKDPQAGDIRALREHVGRLYP
jgi:hypothetical protein